MAPFGSTPEKMLPNASPAASSRHVMRPQANIVPRGSIENLPLPALQPHPFWPCSGSSVGETCGTGLPLAIVLSEQNDTISSMYRWSCLSVHSVPVAGDTVKESNPRSVSLLRSWASQITFFGSMVIRAAMLPWCLLSISKFALRCANGSLWVTDGRDALCRSPYPSIENR